MIGVYGQDTSVEGAGFDYIAIGVVFKTRIADVVHKRWIYPAGPIDCSLDAINRHHTDSILEWANGIEKRMKQSTAIVGVNPVAFRSIAHHIKMVFLIIINIGEPGRDNHPIVIVFDSFIVASAYFRCDKGLYPE